MTLYTNVLNLMLPSVDEHYEDGTFHAPGIEEFLGLPALFFAGTPFEINRIILIRLVAITIMLVLFYLGLRKARRIPGRGQSIAEIALDFVRVQIAEDILGKKDGNRFLPILTTIFFGIFAMNITGIIPGLNMAGSALIGAPLVFGLVAYITFIYAGIKHHGTGKFFKHSLMPPGAPWPVYILLIPVEFINIFIVRPLSLALRLLLNMMVGHLLLVLCFAATHFFVFTVGGGSAFIGVATLFGGFVITLFELMVAALQAYVFTLLATVYIQQAVAEEH